MKRKRILSLLLALTVMATMLMAVPLTGYAAEDAYAEWVIFGSNKLADSTLYNSSNISSDLSVTPTFTLGSGYSNGILTALSESAQFTGYSGSKYEVISSANALKFNSNGTVSLDTKFSSLRSVYDSYDLMVVWVNCNSSGATAGGVTVTVGSNDAINVSPESSSTASLQTYEATDLTADSIVLSNYSKEGRLCYVGLKYNAPTTEAEFELSASTLTIPNGETKTITTKIGNITDPVYTWSSNYESVATVENGVVTGVADGEATITCKVTGTNTATGDAVDLSLTCVVTVASSKTVSVTLGDGLSSATIGVQTITSSGTLTLDYGTYDVSVVNAAPVTYNSDDVVTSFTVGAGSSSTLDLSTTVNNVDGVSFPDEVYEAIEDATVFWGDVDKVYYPTSFGYLNSIQKQTYVPVAGGYSASTSDSDAYAIVDLTASGSKIHTYGRTNGNFQFNIGTVFNVPVVPGSVVTIVNSNSGFTVSENGGTAGEKFSTQDGTCTYSYTGDSNGYVSITSTDGNYVNSVTVTSGDYSSDVKTVAKGDFTTSGCATKASTGTYTVTDAYTDEYQAIFGKALSYVGANKLGYMGYWVNNEKSPGTATVSLTAQNSINKIYILAHDNGTGSNIRLSLADSEGNSIFSDITPLKSETIGYDNSTALCIYTYVVEGLTEGDTYTLTYGVRDKTESEENSDVKLPDVYAASMIGQAFGAGASDSGYYYENGDEQKIGVIRFLQSYAGDSVTECGFYFVDGNGQIQSTEVTLDGEDGFYGDLIGIPNDESIGTYYAMPYVVTSDGTEYADTISGSVDWATEVTDYGTAD